MSKCLPFRWYGGKYSHLDWLLPQLPQTERYIEPYGGSGAVFLNREPSPVEVFNDLDSDVTNFFQVLRDQREKLIEKISLTPFSREEFEEAIEKQNDEELDPIEQARLFFVRAGQVRSGLAQDATPGRWAFCKSSSRRGMAAAVSRWHTRLDHLEIAADRLNGKQAINGVISELQNKGHVDLAEELQSLENGTAVKRLREAEFEYLADRFRRVQIENREAIEVVEMYDADNALIYCDPPYPHSSRSDGAKNAYRFEMSDKDHIELSEILKGCDGKVAISSYRCELTEELYREWNRIDINKRSHTSKDYREESLWLNYPVPDPNSDQVKVSNRLSD